MANVTVTLEGTPDQVQAAIAAFAEAAGGVPAAAPKREAKPAPEPEKKVEKKAEKAKEEQPAKRGGKSEETPKRGRKAAAPPPEPEPEEEDEEEPEEDGGDEDGGDSYKGVDPNAEELQSAKRLRDVVKHIMAQGIEDVEEIVDVCENLQKQVPLLGRVGNIDSRVRAAHELLQEQG